MVTLYRRRIDKSANHQSRLHQFPFRWIQVSPLTVHLRQGFEVYYPRYRDQKQLGDVPLSSKDVPQIVKQKIWTSIVNDQFADLRRPIDLLLLMIREPMTTTVIGDSNDGEEQRFRDLMKETRNETEREESLLTFCICNRIVV